MICIESIPVHPKITRVHPLYVLQILIDPGTLTDHRRIGERTVQAAGCFATGLLVGGLTGSGSYLAPAASRLYLRRHAMVMQDGRPVKHRDQQQLQQIQQRTNR